MHKTVLHYKSSCQQLQFELSYIYIIIIFFYICSDDAIMQLFTLAEKNFKGIHIPM